MPDPWRVDQSSGGQRSVAGKPTVDWLSRWHNRCASASSRGDAKGRASSSSRHPLLLGGSQGPDRAGLGWTSLPTCSGRSGVPITGGMTQPFGKRSAWSWAWYDWANSGFATTVLAGFFPLFFKQYWCAGAGASASTARLGYANMLGCLLIVALAPILGAIADAGGFRKKLLGGFAFVGMLATGALWFVSKGDWLAASVLFVVASVGWMGGNVFYDSLLVNVAPTGRRDWVSSLGYSLGYLGGGLLFAVNVAMFLYPGLFGLRDRVVAVRAAFVCVMVWWAIFSLPLVLFVAEPQGSGGVVRAVRGGLRQRDIVGAVGCRRLGHGVGDGGGCEDLADNPRQLTPLRVLTAAAQGQGQGFQPPERGDLRLELLDGARGGGLIEDFLFSRLDLVLRGLLEVLHDLGIERRHRGGQFRDDRTALE